MDEGAKVRREAPSAPEPPKANRRVSGYFTVYLINELLTSLGWKQRP